MQMINCIGAGITMDSKDTLRVYSYDFIPAHFFVENNIVCSQCSTDTVNVCHECEKVLSLLANVEQVTTKIFNLCAVPSFHSSGSKPDSASVQLLNEVRYRQDIVHTGSLPAHCSLFTAN